MTLVTYSDSEDDDGQDQRSETTFNDSDQLPSLNRSKRKRAGNHDDESGRAFKPPPLPSSLTNLYASNVRSSTNDNPALHEGRQRQIPHVEGNWPSFVYLEWLPSLDNLSCLEHLIACVANEHDDTTSNGSSPTSQAHKQVRSSLRSDLGVRQPLHVSLSAPLILATHNKDTFESELTQRIKDLGLSAFAVSPSDLRWVANFDGTRCFLIVPLTRPANDELRGLLSTCNQVARGFGLPQLYAQNKVSVGVVPDAGMAAGSDRNVPASSNDSKFHISIAWSLEQMPTTPAVLERLSKKLDGMKITFDGVHIKIGNHVRTVHFRST